MPIREKHPIHRGIAGWTVLAFLLIQLCLAPPASALKPVETGEGSGLEELKAKLQGQKKSTVLKPAAGLESEQVNDDLAPQGGLTPQQQAVWQFLTGDPATTVTVQEIDPDTEEKTTYTLNAQGLDPEAVRKFARLLTQNPLTLDAHWRYLTQNWPRLAQILRKTPSYLSQSFWNRHVLRASYLTVLSHRWNQATESGVPLPRFIDLTQSHTPLVSSETNFLKLFPRLGEVVRTDDWPTFQTAWPLLTAIHQRVQAGASWDQDWLTALSSEPKLPKAVQTLLTHPAHAPLRQALFTADGRLADPAYQSQWPLPEAAAGMEGSPAGLEQDVTRWVRGLPIWSRPLEAGQLAGLEAGEPVVADIRGVPSVVRLRKVPVGVAPSAQVSRGRVVMAQSGILPEQTLAGLEARFGAVQLLPRSLGAEEAIRLVAQLRELDAAGPKALLIVDPAGAEQLKAGLEELDPDWQIPAVIVQIPAGLLTATDPSAVLGYLLDLLARADSIPGRQSAGLEATLTLQAERQVLFISTGT